MEMRRGRCLCTTSDQSFEKREREKMWERESGLGACLWLSRVRDDLMTNKVHRERRIDFLLPERVRTSSEFCLHSMNLVGSRIDLVFQRPERVSDPSILCTHRVEIPTRLLEPRSDLETVMCVLSQREDDVWGGESDRRFAFYKAHRPEWLARTLFALVQQQQQPRALPPPCSACATGARPAHRQ
jgi:hypothetical protein